MNAMTPNLHSVVVRCIKVHFQMFNIVIGIVSRVDLVFQCVLHHQAYNFDLQQSKANVSTASIEQLAITIQI